MHPDGGTIVAAGQPARSRPSRSTWRPRTGRISTPRSRPSPSSATTGSLDSAWSCGARTRSAAGTRTCSARYPTSATARSATGRPATRCSSRRSWRARTSGSGSGGRRPGERFRSAMLVRIPIAADGLMEAEIVYQDSADVFMQLGILPRQGSSQERVMRALHRVRTRLPSLLLSSPALLLRSAVVVDASTLWPSGSSTKRRSSPVVAARSPGGRVLVPAAARLRGSPHLASASRKRVDVLRERRSSRTSEGVGPESCTRSARRRHADPRRATVGRAPRRRGRGASHMSCAAGTGRSRVASPRRCCRPSSKPP